MDRIASFLLRSPILVTAFLVGVLAFNGYFLPRVRPDNEVHLYIPSDDPAKLAQDRAVKTFVSDHEALLVYSADDLFSHATLTAIRDLAKRLEALELDRKGEKIRFVRKVTSLVTVRDVVGEDFSFRTEPLVPDPIPTSTTGLARIRARASKNAIVRELLISKDGKSGMMIVRVADDLGSVETKLAAQQIVELTERIHAEQPAVAFVHSGRVITSGLLNHYANQDWARLTGISYVIMALFLFAFMRTFWGMVVGLVSLSLSLGASLAILAATGGVISSATLLLSPLILMLTMAHVIHLFSELGENASHPDAAHRALSAVVPPMFMATLTDSIAFGSLAMTDLPAIRQLGVAAMIAVMVSLAITVAVSVLAFRKLKPDALVSARSVGRAEWLTRFIDATYALMVKRHRFVLLVFVILTLVSTYLATTLSTDTDPVRDFVREDTTFVREVEEVRDRFDRAGFFTILISADQDDWFLEPDHLKRLEELEAELRNAHQAPVVVSILSHLKLMNQAFFSEDPAQYRLPETREQAAQLLLVNDDRTVDEFMTQNGRDVRILVAFPRHITTTRQQQAEYAKVESFLRDRFPGVKAEVTGIARLWAIGLNSVTDTQTFSLASSVLMLFILIGLVFRSGVLALYSMPPNLVPVLVTFGIMAIFGIPLNTTTALVGGIVLGISVDDTTHLLYAYRENLARTGDVEKSLGMAFREKGKAMVWTSLVLILGTLVFLGARYFKGTSDAGLLMSVALFIALIADLLLLPSMILFFKPRLGARSPKSSADS